MPKRLTAYFEEQSDVLDQLAEHNKQLDKFSEEFDEDRSVSYDDKWWDRPKELALETEATVAQVDAINPPQSVHDLHSDLRTCLRSFED